MHWKLTTVLLAFVASAGFAAEPKDFEAFYADIHALAHISKIKISVHAEGVAGREIETAIQAKFAEAKIRGLSPHHLVEIVSEITEPKISAEYRVFVSGEKAKRSLFLLLIDHSMSTDVPNLEFVRRGHVLPIPEGTTTEQIAVSAWYWGVFLLGSVEQANSEELQRKNLELYNEEKRRANQRPEGTPGMSPPSKPSQVPVVPHP